MGNAAFDLVGMANDMRKLVYCTNTERAERNEEIRIEKSNKVFIDRAQNFVTPLQFKRNSLTCLQKKQLDLSPR